MNDLFLLTPWFAALLLAWLLPGRYLDSTTESGLLTLTATTERVDKAGSQGPARAETTEDTEASRHT